MIYTTLNKILANGPCGQNPGSMQGWAQLLAYLHKTLPDSKPLSIMTILESNGIDDALWALRAVDGYEMEMRELVCDFAEHALPIYMITYLGKATKRKRTAAQDTAWLAAWAIARDAVGDTTQDAAWAAARTVAWAAARNVAWNASWHAERKWQRATAWEVAFDAEREWQRAHLIEWLNATGEIK